MKKIALVCLLVLSVSFLAADEPQDVAVLLVESLIEKGYATATHISENADMLESYILAVAGGQVSVEVFFEALTQAFLYWKEWSQILGSFIYTVDTQLERELRTLEIYFEE